MPTTPPTPVSRTPCALGLDFGTASVRARRRRDADRPRARRRGRRIPARRDRHGAPGNRREAARRTGRSSIRATGCRRSRRPCRRRSRRRAFRKRRSSESAWTSPPARFCRSMRPGAPLCLSPFWAARPHAWVKLWKHHAAQPQADRINALAEERGEAFLADYGRQDLVGVARRQGAADPRGGSRGLRRRGVDRRRRRLDRRRALRSPRPQLLRRRLQGILEPRARASRRRSSSARSIRASPISGQS